MKKDRKLTVAATALMVLMALMSGCSSRPAMTQVSNSAEERPINTPETVQQLKKKHEK